MGNFNSAPVISAKDAVCPWESGQDAHLSGSVLQAMYLCAMAINENFGELKQQFKDGMNLGILELNEEGKVCINSRESIATHLRGFLYLSKMYRHVQATIHDGTSQMPWCFYRAMKLPLVYRETLFSPLVSSCTSSLEFAIEWLHQSSSTCCILKIIVTNGIFVPIESYKNGQSEILLQPGVFTLAKPPENIIYDFGNERRIYTMCTVTFTPVRYEDARDYLESNRCVKRDYDDDDWD